ncbi:MAG: flagellar motor protein [Rhodobacterales bacterium CG_4_9_14_3_um_filter_71_31]|nr:MAG: flagellar motor protein [Rhodobacterales bacterium CG_4_9_14_3_um_filter_71_31]
MALARRNEGRAMAMAWPGFVDAMTALLLVVMFVLTIFMIVQFTLRESLSGAQSRLSALTTQLAQLSNVLAMEQSRAEDLEGEVARLSATLTEGRAETARLDALAQALGAERDALSARVTEFEARIAALIGERDAAQGAQAAAEGDAAQAARDLTAARMRLSALEAAQTRSVSEAEALRLTLATLRSEISAEAEAARLAAARADAMAALAEQLRAEKAQAEGAAAVARDTLDAAEQARLLEAAAAEALRQRLSDATSELSAMSLILDEERRRAEDTLTKLAAAEAARRDLTLERDQALSAAERERALLAVARARLGETQATTVDQARELAALNAQTRALREQLGALQASLTQAEAADAEAEVQIAALGERLNAALAREAALQRREAERLREENRDLASYRSEFFGRMREILGGRDDVRVVGDRFVFQSEVLFDTGSAALGFEGRANLSRLAAAIREVRPEIPEGIDWILRIDGHTDARGPVAVNWRLSQERALAVASYLIEVEGLPPERLAPTGFGPFQPVDAGTSEAAYARNRRIEVKFTER